MGKVAEWLKAIDCKFIEIVLYIGSNPIFSNFFMFSFFNPNIVPFVDLCFFFSEFLIALSILYCIIFGLFFLKTHLEFYINLVFTRLVLVYFIFCFLLIGNLPWVSMFFFDNLFFIDFFSILNKFFLLFLFFFSVLCSRVYLTFFRINRYEFFVFILIIFLASSFLLMSNDFLIFYLALELQSLTLYLMATFRRSSPFSAEAGLKYFMLGAVSSGFLLFGISLVYGFTGSINFFSLALLFLDINQNSFFFSYPLFFGLFLIFTSFFFKISAAPFHIWSPDVYEGSPLVSVLFLAVIPKFVLLVVFSRLVFLVFFEIFILFDFYFGFIIVLSFFVSTLSALQQKRFKRFFAFSSISHVGFILLSLNSLNLLGFFSFYFYLYTYSIMNLLTWVLLLSFQNPLKKSMFLYSSNLSNLGKINFALSFSFFLLLMSMAGIPPLLGFFAKFWVFLSGLQSGQFFSVFFGLFASVLSCFYYLRFVKIMFFEDSSYFPILKTLSKAHSFVISFLTISLFFLFIFSEKLFSFFYFFHLTFYGLI